MNYGVVIKVLGKLLIVEAILMLPSLAVSIWYREPETLAFVYSILILVGLGMLMNAIKSNKEKIKAREGLTIVAGGWILVSLFGSLPFVFSGAIPSFLDAWFETISGITTTGATIIEDIEVLPAGMLFWRSFTHWIGGMGILVFTLALLPTLGVGGFQIFRAEAPGPITDKIVPRIKDTAKVLYITYLSLTFLQIIFLLIGGMTFYEACIHTFGTVGTGGFSSKNASIAAYDSTYIHVVISVFMLMAGTNFALYFALYQRKWKKLVANQEFWFYLGIVFTATLLVTFSIMRTVYEQPAIALRDAFFQVSSLLTTTGYATADFDTWPTFAKSILFVLMFIGGSAGSTGGGMKVLRIYILIKIIRREFAKLFHPRAMSVIKVGKRPLADEVISGVTAFSALYLMLFVLGTIAFSLEGISLESAAASAAATLGNIGPGFGFIGPTQTYAGFSAPSKVLLMLFMLLGRLEIFTIIALLVPRSWKNEI